jgi:hypothetical protein
MREKLKKLVKVKLSRYRPQEALGGSGRLRLRIFMTFSTMEVVRSSPLRTDFNSFYYWDPFFFGRLIDCPVYAKVVFENIMVLATIMVFKFPSI